MNLLHKLIALISFLIMIELALVGSLTWMLSQSRMQSEQEALLTQISTQRLKVLSELNVAVTCLWKYEWSRKKELHERYLESRRKASNSSQMLTSLLSKNSEVVTRNTSQELKTRFKRFFAFLDKFYNYQKSDHIDVPYKISLLRNFDVISNTLIARIDAINDIRSKKIEAIKAERMKLESSIELIIKIALVFNIVLPLFLVLLIYQGHIRKLAVIVSNCARFSKGEKLLPPLNGKDELATLDQSFHQMADRINQAIAKERAVIDNMLAGLLICSPEGEILTINNRLSEILESDEEDLVGKNVLDIISIPGSSTESSFETFRTNTEGIVRRLKTSSTFNLNKTLEFSITSFQGPDGERLIANLLDVSDLLELERLKQEFVAMVGHDLKSPLTTIQSTFASIQENKVDLTSDKDKQKIKDAEHESVRVLRFVDDLLELSKLESLGFTIEEQKVELWQLINRAIASSKPLADSKDVKLVFNQSDAQISADPDRILQVLINLLNNAIKFSTSPDQIEITLDSNKETVTVEIHDNGPGIKQEDQKLIFRPYSITKTDSEKGGTGLGLAICKAIIEQHNGEIGVRSKPGKGSTFWFTLPVYKG